MREIYTRGVEWGTFTFSIYSMVCFLVAFALPRFAAATSRKTVHATALLCGSAGLLSVYVIREPWLLVLSMCGVGVLREILQALTFGPLIRTAIGEGNPHAPVDVVLIGGGCLALAALLVSRCTTPSLSRSPP